MPDRLELVKGPAGCAGRISMRSSPRSGRRGEKRAALMAGAGAAQRAARPRALGRAPRATRSAAGTTSSRGTASQLMADRAGADRLLSPRFTRARPSWASGRGDGRLPAAIAGASAEELEAELDGRASTPISSAGSRPTARIATTSRFELDGRDAAALRLTGPAAARPAGAAARGARRARTVTRRGRRCCCWTTS